MLQQVEGGALPACGSELFGIVAMPASLCNYCRILPTGDQAAPEV